MTYEHYTKEPFVLDRNKTYNFYRDIYHKPVGLWISVKGEYYWPWWVESEQFGSIDYVATVELDSKANILLLNSIIKILEFQEKYGEKPYDVDPMHINWQRVKDDYDGIIIAPYQWSLRLDTWVNWYYIWDVASGCIWNLDAIKSISESIKNPNNERQFDNVE